MNDQQPHTFPDVQGRCPACGWTSLFLADGGYITCSRLECPQPDAASTLLERDTRNDPRPADTANPAQPEDDEPEDDEQVQCWHIEPGTPCDWNICRQPERLVAGDAGTDPATNPEPPVAALHLTYRLPRGV